MFRVLASPDSASAEINLTGMSIARTPAAAGVR